MSACVIVVLVSAVAADRSSCGKAAAVTPLRLHTQSTQHTSSVLLVGVHTPLLHRHATAGTSTSIASCFTLFRCSSVNGGVASQATATAAARTPARVHVYRIIYMDIQATNADRRAGSTRRRRHHWLFLIYYVASPVPAADDSSPQLTCTRICII